MFCIPVTYNERHLTFHNIDIPLTHSMIYSAIHPDHIVKIIS